MSETIPYKIFAIKQRINELIKAMARVPKNSDQWWSRKEELDRLKKDLDD